MKFFILLVIYALLWTADCFQSSIPCLNRFSKRYESEVSEVVVRPETIQPDELPWLSPKFSKEQHVVSYEKSLHDHWTQSLVNPVAMMIRTNASIKLKPTKFMCSVSTKQ